MSTALRLQDLDRRTLELLVQAKYAVQEEREEQSIARLLEQSILLEGKKGRGKSLATTALSYQLRNLFGRHVITVGTKLGLKPVYGDFKELTEGQFKDALSKIQDVVEEEVAAEEVWKALKEKGVDLIYATIVFDEA